MFQNGKKLKLTDLIDIEFLQEFQDFFAKTMGVASITVDEVGPITKPSSFTDFCIKYTRGSEEGYRRCNKCDIDWGKIAAKSGKPVIYTCHSGLTDFAVPIIVGGQHIASILAGQVLTEPPNEEHFRELARELGIDEEKYIKALKKIKVVPRESVEAAANFLYLVANAVSKIGHKNYELIKKSKRENLYKHITEAIRSSLDMDKTKKKIVNIVGKTLDADRCFIMEYDKVIDKFLIVKDEYLSSDQIKEYSGADTNADIPSFIEEFKKGNYLVIENKKIFINNEPRDFEIEKESIEKFDVVSAYGIPLFYNNELLGILGIHYLCEEHKVNEDKINLLKTLADQIAVSLYQAKLLQKTKTQAEREALLRNITEDIRSSLDVEETLSYISEETTKVFNVQRASISEFPNPKNYGEHITRMEFKVPPIKKGINDLKHPSEISRYFGGDILQKGKILAIDNISESDTPDFLKDSYNYLGVKSMMLIPIQKGLTKWGVLILTEYNHYRKWSNEEIELAKSIASQIYIAINQAELYKKEMQTAEREALLRNITENIRGSLDIDETLSFICEETAKLFNVQRSAICVFPDYQNYENFIVKKEYKISPKIKGLTGEEIYKKMAAHWGKSLLSNEKVLAIDNIKESTTPNYFKEAYRTMGIKSLIGTSIRKGQEVWGTLVLSEYNNYRHWSEEEKKLLKTIADQVYLAINQAEIYDELKQSTIKQNAILNNMPFMAWLKDTKSVLLAVNEEYAKMCNDSIENIVGKTDFDYFPKEQAELFVKKDQEVMDLKQTISNVEGINDPKGTRWHETFKSPVINDMGIVIGTVGVAKDITEKKEAELELLHRQQQIIEAAKRERILRETIEILRSTLDLEEIKKYFVQIACNYFDADRCLFDDYQKETDEFLPFDMEILKAPQIKSLKGTSVEDEFPEFAKKLKNGKNIIIKNLEKTLFRCDSSNYKAIQTLKQSDVKSDYGLLVKYKSEIMGILILHFVDKKRILTHEEFDFLKTLINQAGTAIYQAELFKKEKETAQRETILRGVIELLRSSLDLKEVKEKITQGLGNVFKADRCYFRSYDGVTNKFLPPEVEYLSSNEIKSLLNVEPNQEGLKYFADEVKKQNKGFYPIVVDREFAKNTPLEAYMDSSNIKADYAIPIINREDELVWLVLHYEKEDPKFDEDYKKLLETIAYQIDIAFGQIKLYNSTKKTAEREFLLRNIIEKIRSSLDIEDVLSFACTEMAKVFSVDRVAIVDFFDRPNFQDTFVRKEYKTETNMTSPMDIDGYKKIGEFIANQLFNAKKSIIINNIDESNYPEDFKNFYNELNVKSLVCYPIKSTDASCTFITLSKINEHRNWGKEDMFLIEAISNQIYTALNQSELYEETRKQAEREHFIRKIFETIRSSLDINVIKDKLVTEVGKSLEADRCFISTYEQIDDEFSIDFEYRSSDDEKNLIGTDPRSVNMQWFMDAFKNKNEIICANAEEFIQRNNLTGALEDDFIKEYNIKSCYSIPILYLNNFLGELTIQYTKDYKELNKNDIELLRIIATQAGIAIYQANLYKITKVQAERERISRNIIEILRSTLDKKVIKHLFVKNIGKFFNAGRVIFSSFDYKTNLYLPVDNDSEYLSSPAEKSFVGYDWSKSEVSEYIQPLLEKREFHIYNWDEYIKNNNKGQGFIDLFANSNVKSSYNFPVMYQQKIMGFFCIEFTHVVNKLSDEDINRIRNICTQAGIALYHSDLYQKAQKNAQTHAEFLTRLSNELKDPLNMIIEFSELLSKSDLERDEEIEHLNHIYENAKKLRYLLDNTIENAHTQIDFN